MQALTATLTSATMLIHALVGCGCQFAEQALGCDEACAAVAECDDDCEHHDAGDVHHTPAAPCKCHFECRSVCIGLPRQKSLTVSQVVAPLDSAVADAVPVDAHATAMCAWQHFAAAHVPEPPLRLHLLHQSLLI